MQPGDVIEVQIVGNSVSETYSNHFEIDVAADNFDRKDGRPLPPDTKIVWKQVRNERVVDHIAIALAPARKKSKGSPHTRYEEWIEQPQKERNLRVRVRLAVKGGPMFVPPHEKHVKELAHPHVERLADESRWMVASTVTPLLSPLRD
jgi:hypothetical protein